MNLEIKAKIIKEVLQALERERSTLIHAALTAHEAATHEESIAEDKYDTRGLEASYLAGAQAKRAAELERMIFEIGQIELNDQSKEDSISVAALTNLLINEKKASKIFILPHAAGISVTIDEDRIQVVTPSSPLGKELIGREKGDQFDLVLGAQRQSVEIVDFF